MEGAPQKKQPAAPQRRSVSFQIVNCLLCVYMCVPMRMRECMCVHVCVCMCTYACGDHTLVSFVLLNHPPLYFFETGSCLIPEHAGLATPVSQRVPRFCVSQPPQLWDCRCCHVIFTWKLGPNSSLHTCVPRTLLGEPSSQPVYLKPYYVRHLLSPCT